MEQSLSNLFLQPTMRKHLGLCGIGLILGMLAFTFLNFEQVQDRLQLLLSGLLGILVAYTVSFFNELLNRYLDWRNTGIRLLVGTIANGALSMALVSLAILCHNQWFDRSRTELFPMKTVLELAILIAVVSLVYNIIYFAFYSYNHYSKLQLAELRMERRQAELQLATLKTQLSPHFLFNCINSLSVLFHDRTQKAETFIRSMAGTYQYALQHHSRSLVTLDEEMQFVQSYVFLLKTRFGEAFHLKTTIDADHLTSKIPPLTLQLLVENAVNHNLVHTGQPMIVHIYSDRKNLVVMNNKVPKKMGFKSSGIGLKNIVERYRLLSKSTIAIADGDNFKVTLPILADA